MDDGGKRVEVEGFGVVVGERVETSTDEHSMQGIATITTIRL